MANADFKPKQTGTPGGFDAGSYREKASPEQAVQLTPLQQKLAGLEAKLPAALTRQAVALALSIVVMLAAFAGFGSAKVRSKYNTARQWFTVGVSADNGYNLSEEPPGPIRRQTSSPPPAIRWGPTMRKYRPRRRRWMTFRPVWTPCSLAERVRR